VESSRGRWTAIVTVVLAVVVVVVIMVRVALFPDEPDGSGERAARKPGKQFAARPSAAKEVEPRMELIPVRREVPRRPAPGANTPAAAPTPSQAEGEAPTPEAKPTLEPGWEASREAAPPGEMPELPPPPPPSDYGWQGPTGIGLFPPPGTNPPKPGIIVPDDYPLPPGYIRYHQTTDDGRALQPILAFSPDYDFVDAAGNPVEIPETGIVPPGMAPPGLPVEILEVPAAHYPSGPSQEEIERVLDEHPEYRELSPEELEKAVDGD